MKTAESDQTKKRESRANNSLENIALTSKETDFALVLSGGGCGGADLPADLLLFLTRIDAVTELETRRRNATSAPSPLERPLPPEALSPSSSSSTSWTVIQGGTALGMASLGESALAILRPNRGLLLLLGIPPSCLRSVNIHSTAAHWPRETEERELRRTHCHVRLSNVITLGQV